MAQIVTNIIQNSLSGLLGGVVQTAGGYAGDAIAGIGDFVESTGQAAGNGIASRFDGWGNGISSYGGTSTKNTTSSKKTVSTSVLTTKSQMKSVEGGKKKAITSTGIKKTLPSNEKKLLMPPPSKGTASTATTSRPAGSGQTKKTISKQSGLAGSKARVTTSLKASPLKATNNTGGKVIPEKRSLPASKKKTSASPAVKPVAKQNYKGPIPLGSDLGSSGNALKPTRGYKPNAGFSTESKKIVSNNATGYKSNSGSYGGPLNLGSVT